MDLTVEIGGDIGTLEEALRQFTGTEILEGENKYQCSRLVNLAYSIITMKIFQKNKIKNTPMKIVVFERGQNTQIALKLILITVILIGFLDYIIN